MIDPNLAIIASKIKNDINTYCLSFDDGHRTHLGASIIGDKCKRKLWFTFHWVFHQVNDGKKQRIFDTGHKEEIRMTQWLKGAGYDIKTIDPKTEKQFRVTGVNGHFGGSLDGIVFISDLNQSCLVEFKTNKTGSEFNKLCEIGVEEAKEKHWSQVCTYGYKWHLDYVLYVCKNKDNDELHVEIAKLNHNVGKEMEAKAAEIIMGGMPTRISETPAYFECKFCSFLDVCHRGITIETNCRSCRHSEPVENGEWKCNLYNNLIPKDFIPNGCGEWKGVM